jgi:hypothetical protein
MYTGGTVCISTPASWSGITNGGTEQYVDVGFPNQQGVTSAHDFQLSTTTTNWITSTATNNSSAGMGTGQNYWPLLGNATATAWPSIGANATGATNTAYTTGPPPTTVSGKVVRFATGNLTAATTYCFNFKDGSGTVGAETSTSYSLQLPDIGTNGYQENVPGFVTTYKCASSCTAPGAGTAIMSSNWGTQITSASTALCTQPAFASECNDYFSVSAVVPPILTLSLDSNADSFQTNLDPNQPVLTNGVHALIQTNAKGGWVMWTRDLNQGLSSAASGGHIPSVAWATCTGVPCPTTLANTTPGGSYGINAAVASNLGGTFGPTDCGPGGPSAGTAVVEPEYSGTLTVPAAVQVGPATTNWANVADCTASTSGTDSGSKVTFVEGATVTFSTPASTDYTDTIYVAAAGQF